MIWFIIAWLLLGLNSFIYWWTKQYDMTVRDLLTSGLMGAIMGPIAFFYGWLIHGDPIPEKIIIKKRTPKP